MSQTPDEYLSAFVEGAEFVLLAIEGRLAQGNVDPATREDIARFLEDYHRMVDAQRALAPKGDAPRNVDVLEFARLTVLN